MGALFKFFDYKAAPTWIVGAAVAAFFASLLGFSNLVRYLYPLQGYGGLIFLVALAISALVRRRHT